MHITTIKTSKTVCSTRFEGFFMKIMPILLSGLKVLIPGPTFEVFRWA
jgi:hypothetical protein